MTLRSCSEKRFLPDVVSKYVCVCKLRWNQIKSVRFLEIFCLYLSKGGLEQ